LQKLSLTDRMYLLGERITMKLVPQEDVGPVFKWLFKFPILLFTMRLGWMLAPYVLLLTTTGRRSGKARRIQAVGAGYEADDRPAVGNEDERLHDLANGDADRLRGVFCGAGALRERADLDREAEIAGGIGDTLD